MEVDPQNIAVNLNYGLLMAEQKKFVEAEKGFRSVLQADKNNPTALYNLSIIVSSRDLNEACKLSRQAMQAVPDDPKYAFTHAYFLNGNQQKKEALALLERTVKKFPDHLSSVFLLGSIYLEGGNKGKAIDLYYLTLNLTKENQEAQAQLMSEIARIKSL
jgi:cytochrome c-type biogenesis protein CcmH/NrfG